MVWLVVVLLPRRSPGPRRGGGFGCGESVSRPSRVGGTHPTDLSRPKEPDGRHEDLKGSTTDETRVMSRSTVRGTRL